MRAAAILGLGCSAKDLKPFQADKQIDWLIGMPASSAAAEVILLFGGDGTVHRHLGQLVKLGLPVLIVPAGSGNDFATSLGLARVRHSLAAWKQFCGGSQNIRPIDLGIIEPTPIAGEGPTPHESCYFCCVAGVGFDGEVSRRANRLPRWLRGHGGYVVSAAQAILSFAPLPMKIFTAEQNMGWTIRSDQPTLLAAFANTPIYGHGMKVAPRAKIDDGLLDICIVGGVDPFRLFCMFPTVYVGKHLAMKEVSYFKAPRARVETEYPLEVYADGEYVCRTPVDVSIQPTALKVVTLNVS